MIFCHEKRKTFANDFKGNNNKVLIFHLLSHSIDKNYLNKIIHSQFRKNHLILTVIFGILCATDKTF